MSRALRLVTQLLMFVATFSIHNNVPGTMGPLLPDTTTVGNCDINPDGHNLHCIDLGVFPDAVSCANACANISYCSAITWHGPSTGEWAGHCLSRTDDEWNPSGCGSGCDHTASNKTSGWQPKPPVPWGPTITGYTGFIKPFWFGANASGLDSPATLALLGRHAVAGYGWQQGGGGVVGTGDAQLAAASTHVADYLASVGNPNNTVVFVYRQIQVALRLFAQCALAALDPSKTGFWLADPSSGAVCLAGQPWGTQDPYWNFSSQAAADYWVNSVIGELTMEPQLINGGAVFFDEVDQGECGYRGGTCDFSKFNATSLQAAKNAVYARATHALNSAGIVPIYSLDNRIAASGNGTSAVAPCALPEDDLIAALAGTTWVRFYENWPQSFWTPGGPDLAAAMVANAALEVAAGVEVVLHAGAACPAPQRTITRPGPLGGDVEFQVATYLIVQGPGSTLSLSSGWMDENFCWRPDFDVEFGVPLGLATRTGKYTWTRNFTKSNVALDVESSTGNVYLL